MDDTRNKRMVVLSLLVAGLSVVFIREIASFIDSSFFKDKYVLVIGILSAPDNFQKRLSLRATWLKLSSDISAVYYFVIGERICPIHPLDRINNYTCDERLITLSAKATSETEFTTMKRATKRKDRLKKQSCIGFGFTTVQDITIRKLGILTNILKQLKNDVRVKLVSSNSKTLASVTISNQLPEEMKKLDYIAKDIRPLTLHRDNHARVVVEFIGEIPSLFPSCNHVQWNDEPGVVTYLQLIHFGDKKPWPFDKKSCSYAVMNYTIPDVDNLRRHMSGSGGRKTEWKAKKKKIIEQLRNESKVYGDVLFVDVEDVYRNLPRKLIAFFKRILEMNYFHYILKTDDDSFIDLFRVYNQLLIVNKEIEEEIMSNMEEVPVRGTVSALRLSKLWWWSKVREFWKVQESGKWREDQYRSPAYPSFPCGGGYVINRGIVEYLSENSRNLEYFQGEDVSVGIWLSGLKTTQHFTSKSRPSGSQYQIQQKIVTNRRFRSEPESVNSSKTRKMPDICEWSCENERTSDRMPLCNKVQLSEFEMYDTWNEYITNGFI